MIQIEVTGMADLLKMLRQDLPQKIQQRVIKGMVATGAAVIRREAIVRAPMYTGPVQKGHPPAGTLKRAIYQTRLVAECTPTLEVWWVGVRKGARAQTMKSGNADAYYASWVEYGTQKMSARPYMRPAFEAKRQAAVDAMGTYLAFSLQSLVKAP